MAFWIEKKLQELRERGREDNTNDSRKKNEKKGQTPKRIDNLRIPHQLKIQIKSLGTHAIHAFLTKDLSSTGAYVLCRELHRYPFQATSTLLDCTVELKHPDTDEASEIRFLAKIARVVESTVSEAAPGFGIRMVQIGSDERSLLENYIARHGAPDSSQHSHSEHSPATPPHAAGDSEDDISELDETRTSSIQQAG